MLLAACLCSGQKDLIASHHCHLLVSRNRTKTCLIKLVAVIRIWTQSWGLASQNYELKADEKLHEAACYCPDATYIQLVDFCLFTVKLMHM